MELAAGGPPAPPLVWTPLTRSTLPEEILLRLAHDQQITHRRRDPHCRNLSLG